MAKANVSPAAQKEAARKSRAAARTGKTKEQQAAEIIASSKELLKKQKATATKTPARKGKKAPQTKTTRTTKTRNPTPAVNIEPTESTLQGELIPSPVNGTGINGMVRDDIAQTDPQAMAQALVAVQRQQNTVLISQANKNLDKQVAVDQGLGLQTQLEQEKNATIDESIATQGMKTRQQGAKTSLESIKLQGLNIDIEGETALLPTRQAKWSIKSEEMQIDNQGARDMLPLRQQHWGAKLQIAQVGLQKLNIEIQQAKSELYAPMSITQESDY